MDRGPLHRVPATGGAAKAITQLDASRRETSHRWPHFLPDGRHFLYLAQSSTPENSGIFAGSLDRKVQELLVRSEFSAAYAPPGYLLFLRERALVAQPFRSASLKVEGIAFPLAEPVGVDGFEHAHFSVSPAGVLAYSRGGIGWRGELVWFGRGGRLLGTAGSIADYRSLRLSPDGQRIALVIEDPQARIVEIWIHDLARNVPARFTFDPAIDRSPVWSPDGRHIVFSSSRKGHSDLYLKPSGGAGNEEILLESDAEKHAMDWSRDGRFVLFSQIDPAGETSRDIWVLPMQAERKPYPLVQTPFREDYPHFSPNGRWVAYQSNESGRDEIYVTPFPGAGGKWEVSAGGGIQPIWSADGKELFYLSTDDRIMAFDVRERDSTIEFGTPQPLFQAPVFAAPGWRYDAAADGQRFLVLVSKEEGPAPVTLVVHWSADLKK